ncbi:STAS domain-containing protein [Streptomyces sp. NPDC048269]|uniref:STAS domain-containing protein n=1 Tax=Streptomyces sp. NPDC048269 TaxID=3155753 RepID=UPI00341BC9E7
MSEESTIGALPVTVDVGPDVITVRPTGAMDIEHAEDLRVALLTALTHVSGPTDVVVDLSGLTFCDSAGLNALLRGRLIADASGRTLRLAAPTRQIRRLLELTGSDHLFRIDPSAPA